jgi:hypothetical protein
MPGAASADASSSARALRLAASLHRRAREATWAYQFDRSRSLLHTALKTLDAVAGHAAEEISAARTRTLVNLGGRPRSSRRGERASVRAA